ncbi:MAG: sucrase ferredoxin [Polyangiales bacterium]|nr:hypothetical protein [Myxococcales bacterium]
MSEALRPLVAAEQRCSLMSATQQEPLLGTAPEASAFLLLEVRGAWASKILASELPEDVRAWLRAADSQHAGLRLQFIRAPRRTLGPLALYLCRVGEGCARLLLDRLDDLVRVDLDSFLRTGTHPGAEALTAPLTLVCTHGRRDVCCALLGNPVFDALTAAAGGCDDEVPRVWQASHLGGHRFAPVVLSLPDGHCYGRVRPEEAGAFVAAQAAGHIHLPTRLRGRTLDPAWLQAASVQLRIDDDLRALDALLPGASQRVEDDGSVVMLRTSAGDVRMRVQQETRSAALRPTSCGEAHTPTTHYRATRLP